MFLDIDEVLRWVPLESDAHELHCNAFYGRRQMPNIAHLATATGLAPPQRIPSRSPAQAGCGMICCWMILEHQPQDRDRRPRDPDPGDYNGRSAVVVEAGRWNSGTLVSLRRLQRQVQPKTRRAGSLPPFLSQTFRTTGLHRRFRSCLAVLRRAGPCGRIRRRSRRRR